MDTVAVEESPLTAHDRCDHCGAQAVSVIRSLERAVALMLCGHHTRKHAAALPNGWTVTTWEQQ